MGPAVSEALGFASDDTQGLEAGALGSAGLTLNVLDWELLYLLWVMQDGLTQDVDGTQVSELPVSKQPVNCLAGFPSWNTPKYCNHSKQSAHHQIFKLHHGASGSAGHFTPGEPNSPKWTPPVITS